MSTDLTLDQFLDRGFAVHQFKNSGHRSGMDAVILAATVDAARQGRVADLGAGAGVVGMAVAHRCAQTHVDMFERDAELVALARQSLHLDQNAHLRGRLNMHQADVTLGETLLQASGQPAGNWRHVLANPPFNDGSHRASPDQRRSQAHMAEPADIENWIRSAAKLAGKRGRLTLIVRPENLLAYGEAVQRFFGGLVIKPVHPFHDRPAGRVLLGGTLASRASAKLLAPLILHRPDGVFTDAAEEVLRGRAQIDLFS